jgi:hypothetical protein
MPTGTSGIHGNSGQQIRYLSDCLLSRVNSGDPEGMLEDEVISQARDLGNILAQAFREIPPADFVMALRMLVAVHWARYQLLPAGQDQPDLQECRKWSAALLPLAPQLVPAPVRAQLAGPEQSASEDATRAAALLGDYERTGNTELLQEVITLFGRSIDAIPPDHPGRLAMLSNLGRALSARFGFTRQLADLDQLIAVSWKLVAAHPADDPGRPGRLSSLGSALEFRFGLTGQQPDLDQAISLYQEAVAALPVGHPRRSDTVPLLGITLWIRFERTGQLPDLDQAIAAEREALAAAPAGHPDRTGILSRLGRALWTRYGNTGQPADLDEALSLFREGAAIPAGHPDRPVMLSNLGNTLWTRYGNSGQPADLDEAVTVGHEALATVPASHSERPAILSNLANALLAQFGRTGQLADLDQAVTLFRDAVAIAPIGHPYRPRYLSNMGGALQTRYGRGGQLADLDEAVAVGHEALATVPAGHLDRLPMLFSLGTALKARFERTGQLADLDQAVTLFRDAVAATAAGHPARAGHLSNLGGALRTRFGRTGQLPDLEEAITYSREAVAATAPGYPALPGYLSDLGGTLKARFDRTGQLADLDQAVTLFRDAVAATPASAPARPARLSNLGAALQTRFDRTGQLADLEQAVTAFRDAVAATPASQPARPAILSNLGAALRTRFERTGQPTDLDDAIAANRDAVAATPPSHPSRPGRLTNLGNALHARFGRTGQSADLDEAIAVDREAVDAIPADHPDRPGRLSSLGGVLQARFGRTGQLPDLDQAITLFRDAVDGTPADHPDRAGYLADLGGVLQDRFGRTGQLADLDQAITIGREAVAASRIGQADRPRMLSNLGAALQTRFERTGQPEDLDNAIAVDREALDATPAGHPSRPVYLSNLAGALWSRFGSSRQLADIDQAITAVRAAIAATPVDHPAQCRYLSNLGRALQDRHERSGQRADLDQALEAFRAASEILTASAEERVTAAQRWGRCALLNGDPGSAAEGYAIAVELLPVMAWHGLDQPTREHYLRQWAGLAADAAAAAVAAGQETRAVELLETGRSVLWTEASHLRHDLAALRERAPDLAAALETSRAVLNEPPGPPVPGREADAGAEQVQREERLMLEGRRQAARDWDAAVERIRLVEDFENFLRPVPFSELRAAASGGPVVIVNISGHASHALIVTPATGPAADAGVVVVELPAAPMGTVIGQAGSLVRALSREGDPAVDWQAREEDRHAVFNILAWSWEAITEPILTALSYTRTPGQRIEEWPRLWWSPTGPAAVLPLHAAGRHPRTITQYQVMGEAAALADSVAGRVISSYTPTVTALTRSRARSAPDRVRQLAVGLPEAPAYRRDTGSLPAVPDELEVIASYLPPPGQATHLLGATATYQAVLKALPGHSWLHLACHGVQHRADAGLSAFLLYDQPLTLAGLAALNLPETDLAYLSACQTATGDLRLLDEALHLAGALQLVGYRQVLATLWSIADDTAPAMADVIYATSCTPTLRIPAQPTRLMQPGRRSPCTTRSPTCARPAPTSLCCGRPTFTSAPEPLPPGNEAPAAKYLRSISELRPKLRPIPFPNLGSTAED